MRAFESGVADQSAAFVRHREAAGAICESYKTCLRLFDAHCAERFPGQGTLTQEMADSWCARRPTELARSCRSRCYAVVSLVRFLRERGLTDARDPELPRDRDPPARPHAFTDAELSAFFAECDSWRPARHVPRALENLLAAADEAGLDALGGFAEDLIAKEQIRLGRMHHAHHHEDDEEA